MPQLAPCQDLPLTIAARGLSDMCSLLPDWIQQIVLLTLAQTDFLHCQKKQLA